MSGFQGIVAGCLVGVLQVMPDDAITVLSFIKFRAKVCLLVSYLCPEQAGGELRHAVCMQNLSFVYVVAMSTGAVLLHQSLQIIPSVVFGTCLAWCYLRFLQQHSGALGRYALSQLHTMT